MTSDVSSQVIVVGAGLAGVALGRRLFQSNIPCVVLERRDVFSNDGFAVNLPGNAIAALSQMGLRDAISRMGRPTRRREYRDHRDRLVFEIDEDTFWGLDHRPRCVKRSDLLAALREGLPADLFRMSCAVTDIRQTDATVIATFEDGRRSPEDCWSEPTEYTPERGPAPFPKLGPSRPSCHGRAGASSRRIPALTVGRSGPGRGLCFC